MIELRRPLRLRPILRARLPQFFRPDDRPHLRFRPPPVVDSGVRYRMWVRPGVATEPVVLPRLVSLARQPFPRGVLIERLSDLHQLLETP